jgi:biotin carboxyl carrier protein
VAILDSRTARRRAAQQSHDGVFQIRAPMPGKVIKVLLAEGAEVQANQGIVVLEAMKMQNEIKSPKKGVVRKLGWHARHLEPPPSVMQVRPGAGLPGAPPQPQQ